MVWGIGGTLACGLKGDAGVLHQLNAGSRAKNRGAIASRHVLIFRCSNRVRRPPLVPASVPFIPSTPPNVTLRRRTGHSRRNDAAATS